MRLQDALRSVAKRASDLGVLLVDYSKPESAHSSQKMVLLLGLEQLSANVLLASHQRRVSPVAGFKPKGVCPEKKIGALN